MGSPAPAQKRNRKQLGLLWGLHLAVFMRGISPGIDEMPFFRVTNELLNHRYINRRRAFFALFDIECNPCAFLERFKTSAIDA